MAGQGPFVSFAVNNAIDVVIIQAGIGQMIQTGTQGYLKAVTALGEGTVAGDLEKIGKAKEEIAQYADALEALGQEVKKAKEFGVEPALAKA